MGVDCFEVLMFGSCTEVTFLCAVYAFGLRAIGCSVSRKSQERLELLAEMVIYAIGSAPVDG